MTKKLDGDAGDDTILSLRAHAPQHEAKFLFALLDFIQR